MKHPVEQPNANNKGEKSSKLPDYFYTPCHICGGTEFEFGTTTTSFWRGFRIPVLWKGKADQLYGRECLRCGNVQLFRQKKWFYISHEQSLP